MDVVAYDDHHMIIGECKYRNKAIGLSELQLLQTKAQFVQSKGREIYYLLASRSGFTEDVLTIQDPHVIRISPIGKGIHARRERHD